MESIAASLIALLLVAPLAVFGASYEVQWSLSGDYSAWPSKNIYVGDEIVFTYSAQSHNVYVVSKDGYTNCDTSSGTFLDDSGNTKYTLTTEGPVYFICGVFGHCPPMQLQVNVKASSSSSTNNTSSPPPSPVYSPGLSSLAPPSPPASKENNNGASSTRSLSWFVFGVSVIFATLLNVIR